MRASLAPAGPHGLWLAGLHVLASDPDPEAGQWLRETVDNAWPVMEKIGLHPDASLDRLRIAESLETMAASADFIQDKRAGTGRTQD